MPFIPPTRQPLALAPLATQAAADLIRGAPSPIRAISSTFTRTFFPPPRILDSQNIPRTTPFILIFNHYESARIAAWWGAVLAANEIARVRTAEPRDVHFVMAREWWYADAFGRIVKQPITQWLFARAARVYGLVPVPPILDTVNTRGQGALGVRRALAMTRGDAPALIGIAPEGRSGPNAQLCEPPEGAGIFLLLLSHQKIPLLPLGIYEQDNILTLRFGETFMLKDSRAPDRATRDRDAATQVMQAVAALLPAPLHGLYPQESRRG